MGLVAEQQYAADLPSPFVTVQGTSEPNTGQASLQRYQVAGKAPCDQAAALSTILSDQSEHFQPLDSPVEFATAQPAARRSPADNTGSMDYGARPIVVPFGPISSGWLSSDSYNSDDQQQRQQQQQQQPKDLEEQLVQQQQQRRQGFFQQQQQQQVNGYSMPVGQQPPLSQHKHSSRLHKLLSWGSSALAFSHSRRQAAANPAVPPPAQTSMAPAGAGFRAGFSPAAVHHGITEQPSLLPPPSQQQQQQVVLVSAHASPPSSSLDPYPAGLGSQSLSPEASSYGSGQPSLDSLGSGNWRAPQTQQQQQQQQQPAAAAHSPAAGKCVAFQQQQPSPVSPDKGGAVNGTAAAAVAADGIGGEEQLPSNRSRRHHHHPCRPCKPCRSSIRRRALPAVGPLDPTSSLRTALVHLEAASARAGRVLDKVTNGLARLTSFSTAEGVLRLPVGREVMRDWEQTGTELGRGASCVTRLVYARQSGAPAACKTILKSGIFRSAAVKAAMLGVQRELAIMQHTNGHPHVVQLRGVYEDSRSLHLVMELCSGGSLEQLAHRAPGCRLGEVSAAAVAKAVLEVLALCHAKGVMHRDIKPENVLLSRPVDDPLDLTADLVKVTDFGISLPVTPGKMLTELAGTLEYMAPEVLGRCYNQAADVWSTGVMLYELISGQLPFTGRNDVQLLRSIRKTELDFSGPAWHDVSPEAVQLVGLCLTKAPEERPTAQQLLDTFSSWLDLGCGL